jgi:hypothetical protein
VKIVKNGATYSIWLDDRFVGSSNAIQPASLHFSGGGRWMSNYGSEPGEHHFDYIKITARNVR